MDPVGQGSFIPKASLAAAGRSGSGIGIFLLLTLIIFIASIAAAGAAFGYERLLNAQLAQKDKDLRNAEGAFDSSTIADLVRLDNRLIQAENLLQKHVAPSAIFYFLSTITLERVQLGAFDFSMLADGSAAISLNGIADSFSSVALQSDQFGSSKSLRDVIVSGVTVGESGKVNFSVGATVDPALVSYLKNLQQTPPTFTPSTPVSTTTPVTPQP